MRKFWAIAWSLLTGFVACSGVGQPIGGDHQQPIEGTGGAGTGGDFDVDSGDVPECLRRESRTLGPLGGAANLILEGRCDRCGWGHYSVRCVEAVAAIPTLADPDHARCADLSDAFAECMALDPGPTCSERLPAECAEQCAALAACW